MKLEIYFDGACNNNANPKLMGIGVHVVIDGQRNHIIEQSFCAGIGTNNIAEWLGLNTAMAIADYLVRKKKMKFDSIDIYGDSQLVVNQYNMKWQIKERTFLMFFDKCRQLRGHIQGKILRVHWIRRNFNKEADKLSKQALEGKRYTADDFLDVINYNNL